VFIVYNILKIIFDKINILIIMNKVPTANFFLIRIILMFYVVKSNSAAIGYDYNSSDEQSSSMGKRLQGAAINTK